MPRKRVIRRARETHTFSDTRILFVGRTPYIIDPPHRRRGACIVAHWRIKKLCNGPEDPRREPLGKRFDSAGGECQRSGADAAR